MTPAPDIDYPPSFQSGDGPLVSVVLATYEPEHTIEDSLRSVVEQTYDNVELVVVDSSGEQWLADLGDRLEWVTYVHQNPVGVAAAWNRGIDAASGDIVAFLADDDYYAPEKLERQVEAIQQGADVVYTDEYVIDPDGSVTELPSLPIDDPDTHYVDFFRVGHGVPHLTVAGRTECFRDEQFLEDLQAREDPHLWVRLFRSYEPAHIPEPLAYKRRRDDSLTSDPEMMYQNEVAEVADLAERFDELEAHREERERMTKYRYGKQLFHDGQRRRARGVLFDTITSGFLDYRTIAMLAVTLSPVLNETLYGLLERANSYLVG
jgi:glycosyltransferase involved in cell wall biosynthesis